MSHDRFMALALALGRRAQGRTWPNPAVGCVLVRDGQVVGRGWTADGGRPHAEPQALQQAGSKARGATAYVTLEPCAHHGKTPPCAQALIDAGVAGVLTNIVPFMKNPTWAEMISATPAAATSASVVTYWRP